MRAGSARRCAPRDVDGEKVTVTRRLDSEEKPRAIGEEIEELQRAGHKLNDIAILVRASFQMREFEDRFVTLGLALSRDRRPQVLRARGNPRRAGVFARDQLAGRRSRLRAHRHVPSAVSAMLPCRCCTTMPAAPHSASEAARAVVETDELKPKARSALRDLVVSSIVGARKAK